MCSYIKIFNHSIPSYGLMISTGIVLANVISILILNKYKRDINDFIVCEGYLLLGAVIGSKILYLWVSREYIAWEKITNIEYFNSLMQGGFVFYGGLLGGLLSLLLGGFIHKININFYIQKLVFLIPFIHGFGRIGCFLAGCCYGMPYNGIGAVKFPAGSFAPEGIYLFPIQLVETVILFLLSLFLFRVSIDAKKAKNSLIYYLIGYSIIRFFLEYLRFDKMERGYLLFLSTSQWISLMILVVITIYYFYKKHFNSESK